MESSKIKLPKEVAEAIEYYRKPYTKYGIFDCILSEGSQVALKARKVLIDTYGDGECWDVLMTALVNGYEVEESKEDKVRKVLLDYCNGMPVSNWVINAIQKIYEGDDSNE